ncbi:hypothetical protein [Halorientalis pallida]|uniref:Uncharacterized protein n=1 Tax=Halorientalis pallida TaxID=2479928 RepID=A0A498KWQ6_9EURY|nr:hypothetical protein [Halorientalis pallida]RXK47037.1 hypothetical protein EAF64_18050 [Halorientalis pallida]
MEAIEFEGQDLVIQLVDGHGISKLNLLDPEGSLYASTSIATGETTVRLQIIEIPSITGRYAHYTPGKHELALISGGSVSDTVTVDLNPDLEITAVQQYRDGEYDDEYGKLEITVRNTGTGPTWVSDIVFEDSPYFAANGELLDRSSIPSYTEPIQVSEFLILPGEYQIYVPTELPLLFSLESDSHCNNTRGRMKIIARSADGHNISAMVQFEASGDLNTGGSNRRYSCIGVDANLLEDDGNG